MNLVRVDPRSDPLWDRLVNQYRSSVFHSPRWMQVLATTYGLEVGAYLLLDDAGEPEAGLPFCRVVDLRGKKVVTLPFSDYCDPLVGQSSQWNRLVDRLLEEDCPIAIRCLHTPIPLADQRFEQVNQAKWHGLDLRPDLDSLWRRLPDSARRAIRKARQQGVEVHVVRQKEELRTFFELHLGVRKYKYRLLAQPYSFFENIWQQFIETQHGLLLVAVHQGEMIGGVLFLEWKDGLYYKFNASAPTQLVYRPNDLLIWEGICYGKGRGCTHLDFGLSDWDQEGLVRYKRKFATEEKTIYFLRCGANGASTEPGRQMGQLLPQLAELFTTESVPDRVTEKAGEILYRFFI